MHVVICDVKPEKGLMELFVLADGRQILACWLPNKFPDRVRLEKILKGKALQKDQFMSLSTAVADIVGEQIKGKPIKELLELVGQSYYLDWKVEPSQTNMLADW